MASAWRIVRASRAKAAFTGEGPWRYGGRWNSPGIHVVYVSEHQSTAALEIFVHRVPFVLEEEYKAFRLEWPESLVEVLSANKLPADWRISPPSRSTIENWRPLDSRGAFCSVGFAECNQPSRYKFSSQS